MRSGVMVQRQTPQDAQQDAGTKRDLTTWWKGFSWGSHRKEEAKRTVPLAETGIFGVALNVSINYANVAISLHRANGDSYIYGYVPTVVAKCGVFLKDKATETEGIFRVAGAERRVKELMNTFSSPERYGKGLDWTGYTVHDAANLLRRYLNQLPDPIIPLETYYTFREPLIGHQAAAVGEKDLQRPAAGNFDLDGTLNIYKQLITELPTLNRQLLLYILDLLAVFAAKSDLNMMDASNLSVIFQPGILRHPDTDLVPEEYRLSQDVLIFLIVNQDHFIVGMEGTEADEKTIQDVESASKTPSAPSTPKARLSLLGRSNSTTSAGSENVRRLGGLRRKSNEATGPITPPGSSPFTSGAMAGGVHRSNTVPSQKSPRHSPALPTAERFQPFAAPAAEVPGAFVTPATPTLLSNSVNTDATSTNDQPAVGEAADKTVQTASESTNVEEPDTLVAAPVTAPIAAAQHETLASATAAAMPAPSSEAALAVSNAASTSAQKPDDTPPKPTKGDLLSVEKRGKMGTSSPSRSPLLRPFLGLSASRSGSQDKGRASIDGAAIDITGAGAGAAQETPKRERGFSSFFKSSPHSDTESHGSGRQPKKLQKKRPEGLAVAQSSQRSPSVSSESQPPSLANAEAGERSGRSFTDDSVQTRSMDGVTDEGSDAPTSPRRNPVKWFRGKMQELQEKKKERSKSRSPRRNSFKEALRPWKKDAPTSHAQTEEAVAASDHEAAVEEPTEEPSGVESGTLDETSLATPTETATEEPSSIAAASDAPKEGSS